MHFLKEFKVATAIMKHVQSIYNRIVSCESIWKQFIIQGQNHSQERILRENFL